MPKRRKKAEASQGAPGEWVERVRDRRERDEHRFVAKRGRQPAAAYREEEEAGHRHLESRASRRDFQSHDVFSLLEVYQKLVLSASLKLAAFEPCHYTTMVCGRPVQVIMVFSIGMCRDVEFLLSMPPVFFGVELLADLLVSILIALSRLCQISSVVFA